MKINYFLHSTKHSGGVAVVFEHVQRLRARGHEATVTVPASQLNRDFTGPHVLGVDGPEQVAHADIIVATSSLFADFVFSLPPSKGEKFYFVQHYESLWCGNVDHTYRLPMKKIVVSSWLKRVMAESFDQPSVVVPPAIDRELFRPGGAPGNDTTSSLGSTGHVRNGRRVLVMDHLLRALKGTRVAADAVAKARRKMGDIELVVFGVQPDARGLGAVTEVHDHPRGQELAELYGSADLFLFPTVAEGFGLPPLEAMACGTPVVTTAHTGTGEYATPETCFVVPPHDVAVTARVLVEALDDPVALKEKAEAGRQKSAEFDWDRSIDLLEAAFEA